MARIAENGWWVDYRDTMTNTSKRMFVPGGVNEGEQIRRILLRDHPNFEIHSLCHAIHSQTIYGFLEEKGRF